MPSWVSISALNTFLTHLSSSQRPFRLELILSSAWAYTAHSPHSMPEKAFLFCLDLVWMDPVFREVGRPVRKCHIFKYIFRHESECLTKANHGRHKQQESSHKQTEKLKKVFCKGICNCLSP